MPYSPINDYSGTLGSTLGLNLDQDFAAIAADLAEIRSRLSAIQRTDGRLKNGSASFETLSSDVRAMILEIDERYKGPWQSGILLRLGEICSGADGLYIATQVFYAGASIEADVEDGKLVFMNGGQGSGSGVIEVEVLPISPDFVDGAKLVLLDGVLYVWNGESWSAIVSGSSAGVPSVLELPASPDDVDGAQIVRKIPENTLYGWTGTAWVEPTVNGESLVDGSIPAEKIYSIDLRAVVGNVGELNAGSLNMDSKGYIRGGQTGFNTGNGFWIGYDIDQYKISLGNQNADRLLFTSSGTRIDGSLTISSTSEVQVISNVSLADLRDWYDGGGAPTIPPSIYTDDGAMVIDMTSAVDSSVVSKKFPVAGGELLRVSALFNVTESTGGGQLEVLVLFSNNPELFSDSVNIANYIESKEVLFSDGLVDFIRPSETDFAPVTATIQVPAGMVWASLYVLVSVE